MILGVLRSFTFNLEHYHNARGFQMTKDEGKQVAERIFAKGYTISGWARANKFKRRTVNDVLYGNLGGRTVSPVSDSIIDALVRDGFINSCDTI